MEVTLFVLFLLYVIGGCFWFFVNILEYGSDYNNEDRRRHARNVMYTPIWAFYGGYLLSLKLKKMWADSGLGEDLKTFQKNSQKGAK